MSEVNEQYTFDPKIKKWAMIFVAIGILALVLGIFMDSGRVWASFLSNGWYFTAIALTSVFWVAVNYISQSGWPTAFKRVPEAMGSFLLVGFVVMLIIVVGAFMHWHHIYHWTHEGIMDIGSEHYDKLIAGKAAFFTPLFYIGRFIAYFALWIGLYMVLRKLSIREDTEGGVAIHKKAGIISAIFVVVYGITESTSTWDYIMSIDTHWFSTLFGWYNFASMFVATLAVITLIVVNLKKNGYLSIVTEEHLHDLGKFMFAFTIFWGYLWFSQFMLIWYANIPEETIYYVERFENYKGLFFLNVIMNFAIPFLTLMDRDAKKNTTILTVVAIIIICGHGLDFFLMVTPGTTIGHPHGIGFIEIGMFLGFAGLFALVVGNALTKASLVPKNHPFLDESIHHHV